MTEKVRYDSTRLDAEIKELEEKRAAEVREREEAIEREQRGPAHRGLIRRLTEGIKAGRREAAAARAAQEKVYRKYDEEHPSDIGKRIGRTIERATPITEPVSRAAKTTGRTITKQSRAMLKKYAENQTRARKPSGKYRRPAPRRSPLDGLDGMLIGSAPAKKKQRSQPAGGLDDMLIGAPSRKKKRRRESDDDPFDLGGFRLM